MISGTCRLVPVLLVTVGLGCSSHSSTHGDGGKISEAGAIDTGSTGRDGSVRFDARDSRAPDLSIVEAGAARDTKDAGTETQQRDASDARGDGVSNDAGSRDSKLDGGRDGNLDGDPDGDSGMGQQPDVPVDTAPPRGTCALPIDIPYYASHAEFAVNTSNADHILDFPCADNSGDIVFRIQSNEAEIAYADTFGTAWNTALFFSDTCDKPKPPAGDGMVTCNDDACGTLQSQAIASLAYGSHYLIVSGVGGDSGDVVMHFQRAPIGNGPLVELPQGQGTVSGTVAGIDTSSTCDFSGPKNSYWWVTCLADLGGSMHASTCGGADWDTAIILQIPGQDSLSCQDDDPSCGIQSTVDATISPGAGMSVLTVSGTTMIKIGDPTIYNYILTYNRP